jgi:dihydrofolate reductase
MRKIFLFMNVSLDGYFEAPGHDISGFKSDFDAFQPDSDHQVDTLLFGHTTYNMMKFWSTPEGEKAAPAVAKFFNDNQKYIASHARFDPGWSKVTVLSGDVPNQVKSLKTSPGKHIIMFGSNMLCVSLMQAGLMDEFQLMLNPVVFGAGTPLFKGLAAKANLKLAESRTFPSGNVLLTYLPA